jgi:hypothetical protein
MQSTSDLVKALADGLQWGSPNRKRSPAILTLKLKVQPRW